MNRRTPATMTLIALIVATFVFEVLSGMWTNPEKLALYGSIVPYYITYEHQYWRLLTAMFLHGDGTPGGTVLHLLVNLFSLYNIGRIYELLFGTKRFTLIYFVTGIAASITSWMHITGSSVGASGAIFGVLGALVSSIQRSPRFKHDRAARSIVKQCVFWIIVNIAIGFSIPQVDNAAHIGGLVMGLILGWVLPHRVPPAAPGAMVIDVSPSGGPSADPAARRDDHSPRG
jgi:rhomboid protease GluP